MITLYMHIQYLLVFFFEAILISYKNFYFSGTITIYKVKKICRYNFDISDKWRRSSKGITLNI